jgi:hypothetical protein
MAAGCAVVLCDVPGVGPLVTASNVRDLFSWNFGMRLLTRPIETSALAGEIARYDSIDAAAVTRYIRENGSLERALSEYEAVYKEAVAESISTPWCNAFHEYATRMLSRTDAALHQLWAARSLCHMEALSPGAWKGIELRFLQCPKSAHARGGFNADVAVHNRSDVRLASAPPHPVNLSYHWLETKSNRTVQFDGLRTALPIPLGPNYSAELPVSIGAPDLPGSYVLRVTLVQEGVRWFDSAEPAVFADRVVRVA